MAKQEKLVTLSARFPYSLWKEARELAAKEDLSLQQVLTRSLREYVAKAKGEK